MKKILIFSVSVLSLIALTFLVSCAQWDSPYSSLDGEGYTVSVRFDANGGSFAGQSSFYMVDAFNPDELKRTPDGKLELSLLDPSDDRRPKGGFEVARTDYYLAGWYLTRDLRTDESGNALDEYGELCSVSGREQGYIYSDRFDFETSTLKLDANREYSSENVVATLYAAWLPRISYEFYAYDEASKAFGTSPIGSCSVIELRLPEWKNTGKLDMKDFPSLSGKTFERAYLDEEMKNEMNAQNLGGNVDYERGVLTGKIVKVYTTWRDGEWLRISTAKQLVDNSKLNGNYEIVADLDFSGAYKWPENLSSGEFTGKIYGNGHAFKGITKTQTVDITRTSGGLFATLGDGAEIRDLKVEGASYTVTGSRVPEASFGLLAGVLSEGATLSNVSVTGELVLSEELYKNTAYRIGLLFGDGDNGDIDISGITCRTELESSQKIVFEIDPSNGTVYVVFN